MPAPKLNRNESRVLAHLAAVAGDFGCFPFQPLMRRTRLKRAEVRHACRSLARKGLAEFHRGLWNEDGEPVGSGYGATELGVAAVSPSDVERIQTKWWDR